MADAGGADWLERHTSRSRSRVAEELFLGRRATALDHAVSRVYFTIAVRRWGAYSIDAHHLAAFRAGLDTVPAPTRALDLGTGTGEAAATVAERYATADVVAVDTSARMLRAARQRHHRPNLTFRRCSVAALPFPDAHFDLVTMLNAVPDPIELRRVLHADGHVLAAATTLPVREDGSDWVARWREVGFDRTDAGDVEGGSWEVYRRSRS